MLWFQRIACGVIVLPHIHQVVTKPKGIDSQYKGYSRIRNCRQPSPRGPRRHAGITKPLMMKKNHHAYPTEVEEMRHFMQAVLHRRQGDGDKNLRSVHPDDQWHRNGAQGIDMGIAVGHSRSLGT